MRRLRVVPRTAIVLLVCAAVVVPATARTTRRQCRQACAAVIQACRDAGFRRGYCRRTVIRTCRHRGVQMCLEFPSTTTPTTTMPSTTTTTLPIDRTVNHCNRSRATDLRDQSAVTVRVEGFDYAPECIRVVPGTPITFEANFASFPLVGGELGVPDPASPFGEVHGGHTATFRIFTTGVYGYYSTPWWIIRMYGAVIVEPR